MRLRPSDYLALATCIVVGALTIVFVWMTIRSAQLRGMQFAVAPLVAYTLMFLAGFVGSMLWVRSQWRELRWDRAERLGRCPRCGYDLHAVAHDLCPECGLPIWRPRNPATGQPMSPKSR